MTRAQADALRAADFSIARSRLVEGVERAGPIAVDLDPEVLLMLIDLQDGVS